MDYSPLNLGEEPCTVGSEMQELFLEMWATTLEFAPWLLLGSAIAGAMHAYLPEGFLQRKLSGRWGVLKAVGLGVPLPLCSCGVLPVGLGLKKQGAGDGPAVGFLISTPQTGVDSILVTASLLGWPLALFKVVVALVTGLVGGWLTEWISPKPKMAMGNLSLPVLEPSGSTRPPPKRSRLRDAFLHADELLQSIWRWLVVGIVISAAISVWIPPDAFSSLASYGALASMGAALGISLPLYVCATASAPIAAALVSSGLPLGAVLVFLMAGPATNAATIGAVYRGLGPRPLLIYLTTIIGGSILGGLLFEKWFSTELPATLAHTGAHTHGTAWWAVASAIVLGVWLARFVWSDLRRIIAYFTTSDIANTPPTSTLHVKGLTCQNCVHKLETALRADPAVRLAKVDLVSGETTIWGTVPEDRLHEIITEAGFSPTAGS